MNKLMFKFAIAAVVGLGVSALPAQEMGEEIEETAEQAVEEGDSRIPEIVPVPEDRGSLVAVACQTNILTAADRESTYAEREAKTKVVDMLSKKLNLTEGFIDDRFTIMQVGVAISPLEEDELEITDVALLREMLVRQAELDARIKIVSSVRQKMSGNVSSKIPGTEEFERFNKDHANLLAELARQKEEVRVAVKALDPALSDRLNKDLDDESWLNQMKLISGRLAKKFAPEETTSEIQAKLIKVETSAQTAAKQITEINTLRDKEYPPKTNETAAESFAKMRLIGSLDISQAENWDGKNYAVAVAVLWSPKLQERALMTLWGEQPKGGKQDPYKRTLNKWLKQQEDNGELAKMAGTRQFVDAQGCQYVLGISAVEVPVSGTIRERKMIQADQFAKQMVLFYLYSQGEGATEAKGKLIAHDDRASDLAAAGAHSLYGEAMNFTISGLTQVYTAICEHPISKREIYVSVAAVNPLLAAKSSEILKSWYASATVAKMGSQYAEQEQQAMEDEHERIIQENEAGKAGYKAGRKAVSDAVNQSEHTKALRNKPAKKQPPTKKELKKPVKTIVVTEDVTDDF